MARDPKQAIVEKWRAALVKVQAFKPTLNPAIKEEMALRKQVIELLFPKPVEGTNKVPLEDGFLNFSNSYTYTVDPVALAANHDRLTNAGIDLDELVTMVPKLSVAAYRTLTPAQTKLMGRVLTIKPSTPALTFTEYADGNPTA